MIKANRWPTDAKARWRIWFADRMFDLAWLLPRKLVEAAIVRALYEACKDPGDVTMTVAMLLDKWRPGRKDAEWESLGRLLSTNNKKRSPFEATYCGSCGKRCWHCRHCERNVCITRTCRLFRLYPSPTGDLALRGGSVFAECPHAEASDEGPCKTCGKVRCGELGNAFAFSADEEVNVKSHVVDPYAQRKDEA